MTTIFQGAGYDCNKLKSLLQEAQDAYHELVTGSKAVKVERNGRKVEFTQTNIQDLRLYIQSLQDSIKATDGTNGRKPARVLF